MVLHTFFGFDLRSAALTAVCCVLLNGAARADDPPPPNIVVVFIDDMGWGDFSCFGNTSVTTQNVDRLAAEGLRFEQFYVNSPICSPSRAAISTGQYPQRWQITSFLNNRKSNRRRGMAQWLDPTAPMLARSLKKHGYATGHFGKWHLGGQRDVGDAPLITEYGFEQSLTNFEGLGPRVLPLCDAFNGKPPRRHALGSDKLGRGPIRWQRRDQVTKSFTEAALAFIRNAQNADRPFYVNLWPDDVHSPFFPPAARRGDNQKRTLYHGVLDTMDEQLGVLFDYVRADSRLRQNTLILVCSDNGPERGAGSAGPFRGLKTMLYEGGIRSPLIVWAPGLMDPAAVGGVNRESFFSAIDLVPSLLEVAKAKPDPPVTYDGIGMSDVLLGKSRASRGRPLYFRRPPDRDRFYGLANLPDLAVRDKNWKLLCEFDGTRPELYDLSTDRAEARNLAGKHPSRTRELVEMAMAWHRSMPPDSGDGRSATPDGRLIRSGFLDCGNVQSARGGPLDSGCCLAENARPAVVSAFSEKPAAMTSTIDRAEQLKTELTDKWVTVSAEVPELRRFSELTGRVKTVNMNCRALVEFDGAEDIGWYDIDPSYLTVVDGPREKKKPEKKPVAKPAPAKPAAKSPLAAAQAGGKPPSPLEAARAGAAKPVSPLEQAKQAAKPSPLELAKQGAAAAEKKPSPLELAKQGAAAAPAKPSPLDLARQGGAPAADADVPEPQKPDASAYQSLLGKYSDAAVEVHDQRGVVYAGRPDAVDDLKKIKGVGEVNEGKLHDVGIYRFQQIADWNEYNIWAFNQHLSFSGRIEREDWVGQAKKLAEGSDS